LIIEYPIYKRFVNEFSYYGNETSFAQTTALHFPVEAFVFPSAPQTHSPNPQLTSITVG